MNQIIIDGNLARDPERKEVGTKGHYITKFPIAVSKGNGDSNNVMYVPILAWDRVGEAICKICCKGTRIFCVGELDISSIKDDAGNVKTYTQVVLRDFYAVSNKKPHDETAPSKPAKAATGAPAAEKKKQPQATEISESEEDMPF